ncbi:MAG: hypothetical protein ACYDBT_12045 [Desulfobulbaceae bacterium]
MIRECCVCGRREYMGIWRRKCNMDAQCRVSHGYCPDCYEEFMGRLDRLFQAGGKHTVAATVRS